MVAMDQQDSDCGDLMEVAVDPPASCVSSIGFHISNIPDFAPYVDRGWNIFRVKRWNQLSNRAQTILKQLNYDPATFPPDVLHDPWAMRCWHGMNSVEQRYWSDLGLGREEWELEVVETPHPQSHSSFPRTLRCTDDCNVHDTLVPQGGKGPKRTASKNSTFKLDVNLDAVFEYDFTLQDAERILQDMASSAVDVESIQRTIGFREAYYKLNPVHQLFSGGSIAATGERMRKKEFEILSGRYVIRLIHR